MCACSAGQCVASPAGRSRGHVSITSDVRCRDCETVADVIAEASGPTAHDLLKAAAGHMDDRGPAYDKPSGERSMLATVIAFNAITGNAISESHGWMFMECLKAVRDFTTAGGHADSQEDRIAYAALGGEARRAGR